MKILFIGGTGNISLSVSRQLLDLGHELWLLNRSGQHPELGRARGIRGDIGDPHFKVQLAEHTWDCVVNWIIFTPEQLLRDIDLFRDRTRQYVLISSASCYQNPGPTPYITEKTPLENPFWEYSRNKIAAERALVAAFERDHFPATIVRRSA